MNTIKSIFGSAYSLLIDGRTKTMSKLSIATKKIAFTYNFVLLLINAKAPYYRFSCHLHIAGLECAIVCILDPVVPGRYWHPFVVKPLYKRAWRKITVIGHCIRLIMKTKDDIEDSPYVHDLVDRPSETVAVYNIRAKGLRLGGARRSVVLEIPLFPPDDESGTENGSRADGHIPRQFRLRVDTGRAARFLKQRNSEPRFEAPQLY